MNRGAPISIALAFGWTLAAAFLLWVLVSASVAVRASSATDVVQLGAIEALVFVVSILWVQRAHAGDGPLGASLGLRRTPPTLLALGLLLGFSLHFPAEAVDGFLQRFLPESSEEIAAEVALLSSGTPLKLVLVLLVIACVGPFVEELFFRGALFGALRRDHSLPTTTLVVSMCFVVGHLNVRRWPALVVVALALTYVRAVSGSLLPAIALHVTFNAVTVVAFALGAIPTEPQKIELIPTLAGSVATALLLFAVRYTASREALARRGRAEDVE